MLKFVLVIFIIFSLPLAFANSELIKEVESLKKTLAPDDIGNARLTLKLADLYFDQFLSVDKALLEQKDKDREELRQYSLKRSMESYRLVLNGAKGKWEKPSGEKKAKIQFQIARLHQAKFQASKAAVFYKKVINSSNEQRLKREASLNLAEILEGQGKDKEALKFYDLALKDCQNSDICIYSHYKKAWTLYRRTKLELAITELEKSLFDIKGQIRTQALQDYLLFLSQRTTKGTNELTLIQDLNKRVNDKELEQKLSDAFFAAGNREAGTYVLAQVQKNKTDLLGHTRLLEEYYGFSRWGKFEAIFSKIKNQNLSLPLDDQEKRECHKILTRLIVQLDGQRKSKTEIGKYLGDHIILFLKFFPEDKEKNKMIEGWLQAEDDRKKKIARLEGWINGLDENDPSDLKLKIKYRTLRLSYAQKEKLSSVVLDESNKLSLLVSDKKEKRRFSYVHARELYEQGRQLEALSIFQVLAKFNGDIVSIDEWSIKSQNLALDIFNQQKNFKDLITQADSWLGDEAILSYPKLRKEVKAISLIKKQAQFEYASSLGAKPEALAIFKDFCAKGIFKEKSCPNAKVLAVKTADQKSILDVLKLTKKQDELKTQYELMGKFSHAADLMTKTKENSFDDLLKIATLYELENNVEKRNSTLLKLKKKILKNKKIPDGQEKIIYEIFRDSGLVSKNLLKLPWSLKQKMVLVNDIEGLGHGNKQTRKILMASTESSGPAWSKYVLSHLETKYKTQKKVKFYGRGSERKFKRRISKIEKLVSASKKYLDGADLETRIYILTLLERTYLELSDEIAQTPLPDNLPAESINEIKTALNNMAAPFIKEKEGYTKLKLEQLAELKEEKLAVITQRLNDPDLNFTKYISLQPPVLKNPKGLSGLSSLSNAKELLEKDPYSIDALTQMASFFETKKLNRLAAYFEGRLKQIKEQK